MKKLFVVLLALTMVLSLTACNDKKSKPNNKDESQNPDLPTYTFTQYGNAKITIMGAEFTKSNWDEDVLRVYYDYTNTGDMGADQYPNLTLHLKSIIQDGEECEETHFSEEDDCFVPEDLNGNCEVQPGLTARSTMLMYANPEGGPVEISCYVMSGSWVYNEKDIKLFTFKIDPKKLKAPSEPFVLKPVTNPKYAANLATSGSYDDAEVSIDGYEVVKGDEGENVLRVKLTVKNTSDIELGPLDLFGGIEAYQDSLGLPLFVSWYLEDCTEADEAKDEPLMPGETVQCTALYELRNDNKVEVVIEEKNNKLRLGMICDVADAIKANDSSEEEPETIEGGYDALVGTWLMRDSDWNDTYIFNDDGSGKFSFGSEYEFTYIVKGDTLTVTYSEDNVDEFTFKLDGDVLTLIDDWDEEYVLDKQ